MKKILKIVIAILALAALLLALGKFIKQDSNIVIKKGNSSQEPLTLELNKTSCAKCAMLIKAKESAAEVAAKDGRTWFFDDIGCMVKWIKDKPLAKDAKLWVYTLDTKRWIDAKKAYYGVTDHTAMHYGFGAREKPAKSTITYDVMVDRIFKKETMRNPKFRAKLLGE